ncbi:MAG: hypothetical protein KDB61_00870 [Planctomycetes bacterium]|nr:hypothetical protein [Planctomycetota bacterium]
MQPNQTTTAQEAETAAIEALGYAYGLLQNGTEGKAARELIGNLLAWPRELVTLAQVASFAEGFLDAREFRRTCPEFFQ